MIRRLIVLLSLLVLVDYTAAIGAAPARHTLVLVTAPGVQIVRLRPEEIRLVFMGAPVVKKDVRLRPLLNETDPLLREVFLQKIMFVSWKHYQRRLVEQAFREGWPLPEKVTDPRRIPEALSEHPGNITYMWAEDAQRLNVKVVQALWSGTVD